MPSLSFLRVNAPFLFAGFLLSFLSGFGQTYFISVFAAGIRALNGLGHGEWGALGTVALALPALRRFRVSGFTRRRGRDL